MGSKALTSCQPKSSTRATDSQCKVVNVANVQPRATGGAHMIRSVRIHVNVGQYCRAPFVNEKSPTLCKPKSRARYIPLWGNGGGMSRKVQRRALTCCNAEIISARTQQPVSSRVGSRGNDRNARSWKCKSTHSLQNTKHGHAYTQQSAHRIHTVISRWRKCHGCCARANCFGVAICEFKGEHSHTATSKQ